MGLLPGLHLRCDSAQRERAHVETKVFWSRDRIREVFDRYAVGGRILAIQKTGDAKHPVTVGASGIAAKGDGEQLEGSFLVLKVEAVYTPKHLVFVGRCSQHYGRLGNRSGGQERSDSGLAVLVDVYI
jgi:hypothetical protein